MTNNSTSSVKLGKSFSIVAWILFFGLLYLFFDEQIEQQINPNKQLTSSSNAYINEVILKANRQGHFITPGFINNQKVNLMLDTGATTVAIPAQLAMKLGLHKGQSYMVSTANGRTRAYATKLNSLTIGTITLYDVTASITEGFTGNQILLGMSALKQLEFTHSNKVLTLKQYN